VSDPGTSGDTPYVMPTLVGLTYGAAKARVEAAGLHLLLTQTTPMTAAPLGDSRTATSAVAAEQPLGPASQTTGTVMAQSPPAGSRVQPGDPVRVAMSYAASAE
jgi:beta-lactam-binding protein with PASTA domain